MKNQVKVTATDPIRGGSIKSGWFDSMDNGKRYAGEMASLGYIVSFQYR